MENTGLSKYTVSFGISLAVASVLNALLVVAKEKSPSVLAGLQRMTGHHWISHAALVVAVFAALGWLLAQGNNGQGRVIPSGRLVNLLASGIALGVVIIIGFYLIAD